MEKKVIRRTIEDTIYVAFDGREFRSESECLAHEKHVKEVQKHTRCPKCFGEGRIMVHKTVFVEPMDRDRDNGERYESETCPLCKGKGYIV